MSHGERRVSDGRVKGERLVARVHADLRWIPKWTPFLYAIFGRPPAQPLRLALVDPTDRYLRAWKPVPCACSLTSNACFSHFFSLLLPLPTAAFSTIMAKRKATTEQLGARAESNGYKRGAHREKDSTRDNGKHNKKTKSRQKSVLDRYVS